LYETFYPIKVFHALFGIHGLNQIPALYSITPLVVKGVPGVRRDFLRISAGWLLAGIAQKSP
ncbi:MAG: hypothetical protein IKN76_01015, partial [Oscillospiraceae bacterium]|nr:hypothetical protein [Oscillospiraceae bacterium]